jgi:predicted permease
VGSGASYSKRHYYFSLLHFNIESMGYVALSCGVNQVLNTLLPVFVVIALAYGLAKRGFLSRGVLTELNWLLFWICLPALIFGKLATANEIPPGTWQIFLVFTLSTLLVIGLGLIAARMLGLAHWQVGTFVQATFRGNLAYVGIPIILFALQGLPEEIVSSTMAQTLFVFAPTIVVYNVAAVVLLGRERETSLRANFSSILLQIIKNPLILASFSGAVLFVLPISLPGFVLNSLELVGQMASPAALFCVGGSKAYVSMEGRYRSASVAALLKVVAVPCIAGVLSLMFNLSDQSRMVLLILSATPTAVASYVMAKAMKGDEALASGAIILSTVASIPVLAVIVGILLL